MAPRRGPVGLLARSAEVAGARGSSALALVAAALLILAGCGGGEDSSTAETQGDAAAQTERKSPNSSSQQGKGTEGKASDGSSKAKQGESKAPLPEGEREPGITPQQRKKATTASLVLKSPAFKGGSPIPTRFTCEGNNVSPPLRWPGVPEGTSELVLLALNLLPVKGALFFDWAVAGLDPALTELKEGELPSGAILGTNSFGKRAYGLCPPKKGKEERYIFMLYAIPEALDPKPGFDPLELREEVLAESGDVGLLAASYTRR